MKCQSKGCSITEKIIICTVEGVNHAMQHCLNHILMDLEEVVAQLKNTTPFNQKCECCEKETSYAVNYGGEGVIHLCEADFIAFVELNLTPEKFHKLYQKYPNHHMLHDDFYDEETGEAIQPRQII